GLFHAVRPRVAARRLKANEVREIVGKAQQFAIQNAIVFCRERDDFQHPATAVAIAGAIKLQKVDEFLRLFRATLNAAVAANGHVARQETVERVGNALFSLSEIASRADIQKIVVFEFEIRMIGHGAKMIAMKMTNAVHPLLAFEAVNASKQKFIPEPRPEIDGGAIASWSVFATVWPGRVAVAGHSSHRLRAWAFDACFNPRSSSSRTSLRTGAAHSAYSLTSSCNR